MYTQAHKYTDLQVHTYAQVLHIQMLTQVHRCTHTGDAQMCRCRQHEYRDVPTNTHTDANSPKPFMEFQIQNCQNSLSKVRGEKMNEYVLYMSTQDRHYARISGDLQRTL